MAIPCQRGPRALADVLGELFTMRGYGRLRAASDLERAWEIAVGEPQCRQTRLGEVRRGVLSVTVSHSALLEELSAFRKPELLQALRAGAAGVTIHDIRFRVGPIEGLEAVEVTPASEPPAPRKRPGGGKRRDGGGRG